MFIDNFEIFNAYPLEVNFTNAAPTATTKLYFDDNQYLKNVYTYALELCCVTQLAKSYAQNTMISAANVLTLSLILADTKKNDEPVYQLPAFGLVPSNNSGFIRQIKPMNINLTKSYFFVLNAGINIAESVVLIFYHMPEGWEPGMPTDPRYVDYKALKKQKMQR